MTYGKKEEVTDRQRKGKRKGWLGITQYITMREGGGEGPAIKIYTKKREGKERNNVCNQLEVRIQYKEA